MEVVGAAVGSVLTCALNQLGVKSLSEEIQTLRNKKGDLIARVKEVEETLRIAEVEQGKKRTSEAQNWLTNANNVINKADDVDKEANVGRRCLSGVLPNCCSPSCCSRLKLLKQILELTEEMVGLLDEASRFSEESLTFLGMEMPTTRLIGSTADKNFKMVWEYIVGDEFEKIGVYGMGGVGKTTIMKTISNQLVQQCIRFENVLWVTVSKDVDVQKLQNQIAKRVALDLSAEQDEAIRSSMLLSALRRKGKFVLILDDMWVAFDLQALGVPKPTKDNGCKIILTTRSREVCERMLCQKYVKVEQLSKDEAWELFSVNVDEKLVPNVEEIAKEVVAECCGLPLAIITIGRSMRSKDVGEWRVALSDLKNSTSLNMDMTEQVIQRLKFSYDQLKENHQKCFLYCALYPEDYIIDTSKLIEYWVMEGLVEGSSKEDEMLRGRVILNILKRCCMLEEVPSEGRFNSDLVKMHDLIRDMALYITKSKPKFMVRTGLSPTEIRHENDWAEDLERVSFMESGIENISITPKCPKLLTLILAQKSWYPRLKHVASDFFMHMKSLTVLHLSRTSIESLPDSLSDLVNLRGLLLIDCENLVRVPSLSKLQSLRVLKLTNSAIEELPHGMEMLVHLRCLDLSFNSKLKEMIPSGFISKFSLLQELQLERIEPEYVYARERGGDFVQELSSLTHLENLTIKFHELSDFISYGEFTNFEKLKKYFIEMERETYYFGHQDERILCLSNRKGIPCNALRLPKSIQSLLVRDFARLSELPFLQRVENMGIAHGAFPCLKRLVIWSCDNIKVLFSSRLLQQLLNLEEIIVRYCEQLEELVVADGDESGAIPVLPRLRKLSLRGLPKLKRNWSQLFMYSNSWQDVRLSELPFLQRVENMGIAHGAFPCLKRLQIYDCDNIKVLFSSRLLQQLLNLEEIIVKNCSQLEELVVADGDESGAIPVLPRLHNLNLYKLPKLKSNWSQLFMYSNSWQKVKITFVKLDRLFSTRLLQHFQYLEKIYVFDCAKLEELIVEEEEACETVALPRLNRLLFWNLPKLKSIWKGVMVCDSLKTVKVYNCPELKRLPLFNREHQSAPPSLKRIQGSREWWDSLEWGDYPRPEHLFLKYPCPEHLFLESDDDDQ